MPGLDFQRLRCEIPMAEVLELLGFVATNGRGRFYCRECRRFGNQLELWAAARRLPIYDAAVDLFGIGTKA